MRITFDASADAQYLRFHDGDVVESIELVDGVYLDIDSSGGVVGAEFVIASEFFEVLTRNDGLLEVPDHVDRLTQADDAM